jgi:molecular chaperone GrpE
MTKHKTKPSDQGTPVNIKVEFAAESSDKEQAIAQNSQDVVEAELVTEHEIALAEAATEIDRLNQELSESRAKADEYLGGWQRALADFANYKKRVERDQAEVYQRAAGSIIKRYIDILDDLDLALRKRPTEGDGYRWADGIELIYRKLLAILESEGVKPMGAKGQMFDPNFHEAITLEPSDAHESGQIIEVLKEGYLLGEKVLRPAVVRVAQ